MTYDSLDIIPYKTFIKVAETGEIKLLSNEISDEAILTEIWNKMYQEHLDENQTSDSKKVFQLHKNISYLEAQHAVVLMSCTSLRFTCDDRLVDLLRSYGYTLRTIDTETYYNDIERIERETNAYVIKVDRLKMQLPEPNEKNEYSIDDVMASYSAMLGFDIGDFNVVSYRKFKGIEKQVDSKVKAFERQQQKLASNGK